MTQSYPTASTPLPSVHTDPSATTPTTVSPAYFTALIEALFGALAVALAGFSIGGIEPLGFLASWGQNLEAQAASALSTANTAQSTATTANTTANTAQANWTTLLAGVPGVSNITQFITYLQGVGTNALAALTNLINPSRLLQVPVAHISSVQPNVLADPDFTDSTTPGWDGTVTASTGVTGAGSWKVTPNGTDQVMLSDDYGQAIATSAGDEWSLSASAMWTSVTATGTPLMLGIAQYDATGTFISTTNVVAHACSGSSGFIVLTGSYTTPTGVAYIRESLEVTAAATAGTGIWWSKCDLHKTGLLDGSLVQGIENTINADLQTVVDYFNQATGNDTTGNALSTVETALASIGTAISNAESAATNALTQLETLVSNLLNSPATVLGNIEASMSSDLQAVIDGIANAVDGGSATGNPSSVVEPSIQNVISSITSSSSVGFDAVGSGGSVTSSANSASASWTHTVGSKAEYVVVAIAVRGGGVLTACKRTVTYGPYVMASLGAVGVTLGFVEMFGLYNPPTGAQTVTATATTSSSGVYDLLGDSVSYTGWVESGSPFTNSAATAYGSSMAVNNVPSATGNMVVQAFAGFVAGIYGTAVAGSAYNQTQRYNQSNSVSGASPGGAFLILGDAPGATAVSFTATDSENDGWVAIAINLSNT